MGLILHVTVAMIVGAVSWATRVRYRSWFWPSILAIAAVGVVISIVPFAHSRFRTVPVIFDRHRWLFLLTEACLVFVLPLLSAGKVGDSARHWKHPNLVFVAAPLAYLAALIVALMLGTSAQVLVP